MPGDLSRRNERKSENRDCGSDDDGDAALSYTRIGSLPRQVRTDSLGPNPNGGQRASGQESGNGCGERGGRSLDDPGGNVHAILSRIRRESL